MPNFDAASVRAKADELVRADKSNVEDARQIFLEEIMDWSDYYTENAGSISVAEMQTVLDAIVNLWIQCANFEVSLHQFKKAVDVYDRALIDPICSKSLAIFRAYAAFCLDRKKPGNAQNVYIKGLCAGLSEADNQALWQDFLDLMHSVNKSANLTIEQLYEAVRSQDGVDEALLAVPAGVQRSETDAADVDISIDEIDANEAKEEEDEAEQVDGTVSTATEEAPAERSQSATTPTAMDTEQPPSQGSAQQQSPAAAAEPSAAPVERRYAELDGLDDVSGYSPEQLIRTFTARPPMLFTSLQKEPTASGIAALSVDPSNPGVAELEAFLGAPLADLPMRTPNMHAEERDYASWTPADRYLDLLEGMWLAQALKERHFDSWISDLRNMHIEQEALLVDSFLDTESEAAAGKTAEEKAAIKKRQHSELMIFRNHCAVQQELLHALINKALFALLVEQQTQLAQVGFPRFSLQFVETLKSSVQARKNAASVGKTEFDAALVKQVSAQRELVCAFLSVRLQTVSTERSRAAQLNKTTKLSRAQSIDQESEVGSDLNYFDAEAKKRRKRRRLILQHHNDSYSHSGVSSYGTMNSPGGGYYTEQLSPGSDSGAGAAAGGYPPAFRAAPGVGAGYPQQFARPPVQLGGEGGSLAAQPANPAAAAATAAAVLQKLSAQIKPSRR